MLNCKAGRCAVHVSHGRQVFAAFIAEKGVLFPLTLSEVRGYAVTPTAMNSGSL